MVASVRVFHIFSLYFFCIGALRGLPRHFSKGAVQCKAPLSSAFSPQTVSPFHQDPFGLPLPKCCSVLMGCSILDMLYHLDIGGSFCLYNQDESEREVQPVCSYPLPPVGDRAYRFEQGRDERACPCFWSLGWSIRGSVSRISHTMLIANSE